MFVKKKLIIHSALNSEFHFCHNIMYRTAIIKSIKKIILKYFIGSNFIITYYLHDKFLHITCNMQLQQMLEKKDCIE